MTNLAGIVKKEDLPQPDVVKVDVEGSKLSVLTGIDFKNKNLLLVEIEVTLRADTLTSVDPNSDDEIQSAICEIYGLASRKAPNKKLQCGQKNVKFLNNITLIR
jgi:hypothetical protein